MDREAAEELASFQDSNEKPKDMRGLVICFVVRALPVHRLGGLEHHLRDLAVALARRGHEIHIVSTPGGAAETFGAEAGAITVHEIAGVAAGDYSVGFFRGVGKRVEEICRQHAVDVVVPVDMAGMFIDRKRIEAPIILLIHGTMTTEVPLDWRYWRHLGPTEKLRAAWRYKSRIALLPAFRAMVNRADGILVDSEFTRRELLLSGQDRPRLKGNFEAQERESRRLAELAQKIYVAQLGIDPERYPAAESALSAKPYEAGEVLRIALLGRVQKIKGVEIAIRAAAGLRARGVNFQMSIGGSGNFAEWAEALVQELGLTDQVRLVGIIEPVEVGNFMAGHHVFLFPDLTQPAFGLVAVEAMQYGLPVVAARVGAVPEVVREQVGWLYDAWDVMGLVKVLADIAGKPEEIARKGAAARVRSEYFTAERMGERTEAAMRSIAGESIMKNG